MPNVAGLSHGLCQGACGGAEYVVSMVAFGDAHMWKSLSAVALAALLSTGSVAYAQTKEKTPSTPRSEASLECSKQAEEQGLHGKKRKTFRKKCMKEMKNKM